MEYIGRFHILVLHIPIGILLLAVLMDWLRQLPRFAHAASAVTIVYGIGAAAACVACVTGYILKITGEIPPDSVSLHQWWGLLTAILSLVCYGASKYTSHNISKAIGLAMAVSLSITGHLGGSLTHGENYLSFSANRVETRYPAIDISKMDEVDIYKDIVDIILHNKCISCHNNSKARGELRLHSSEMLSIGGKSTKRIVGIKTKSVVQLIGDRISLPLRDKKHMPPLNSAPLSQEELDIFKIWAASEDYFDKKVKDFSQSELLEQHIIKWVNDFHNDDSNNLDNSKNIPADIPQVNLPGIPMAVVEELRGLHVSILPVSRSSPLINVSFVNVREISKRHFELLQEIRLYILSLKLSNQILPDNAIQVIGGMQHLQRLFLDGTNVVDEQLKELKGMNELVYLNVYNTEIGQEGLRYIKGLSKLKNVYSNTIEK